MKLHIYILLILINIIMITNCKHQKNQQEATSNFSLKLNANKLLITSLEKITIDYYKDSVTLTLELTEKDVVKLTAMLKDKELLEKIIRVYFNDYEMYVIELKDDDFGSKFQISLLQNKKNEQIIKELAKLAKSKIVRKIMANGSTEEGSILDAFNKAQNMKTD